MSQAGFYQVGGDLRFQHPSYVKRQSDDEFYKQLKAGEFCYVLNSRQMGKSSLGIQTLQQLRSDGCACCFISLSEIGSEATVEEWYFTITDIIARKLNISSDISSWWDRYSRLSALAKLGKFIEIVLLQKIEQNIVIFIDEIDSIRRLKFSTDDFFALIRACYNNRVQQPAYKRLTFTLLGVATPSALIQNENCTPFNIGKAILLQGFQVNEAKPLANGLSGKNSQPEKILAEILLWTGGQPFLTQKLCKLVAESTDRSPSENAKELVERITQEKIINNWEVQDEPEHLKTIYNRLINSEQLTRKLLWLYQDILQKGEILSDNSLEQWELQLSGLVVNQDGKIKISNPIYTKIFNRNWLNQKLDELNPYADRIIAWDSTKFTNKSLLLQEKELKNALQWANDRNLSDRERQFIHSSEQAINSNKLNTIKLIFGSFLIGSIISGCYVYQEIYNKYASCPLKKGVVGEKIGDVCFRTLTTSGDKIVFLSGSNFYLIQGSKIFKEATDSNDKKEQQNKYGKAKKFFEYAIDSDRTDPVPKIYINNTKARMKGNPLKIAVVVSIDYHEDAAKQVLRGVADAQDEFNRVNGKGGRLLEIVIVNDGNEPKVAEKVAHELVEDSSILAIMGHHASESTLGALPIYKNKVAVVSPTSSSSELKNPIFFRTISSTSRSASMYARYIKEYLKLNYIAIAYNPNSVYSEILFKDFTEEFKKRQGRILANPIKLDVKDINDNNLNIALELKRITDNRIKALFVINSISTNSILIAISKENYNPQDKHQEKLKLMSSMALSEESVLVGGKSVEGLTIPSPCLAKNSKYTQDAKQRWGKEIYWRVATSYDATQVLIEAINRSKTPTRQEILDKLESISLPPDRTSGFGVSWSKTDYHSNENRKYCVYEIKDGKFELIPDIN